MAESNQELPFLHHPSIKYPSDRIDIGMLRRLFPAQLDIDFPDLADILPGRFSDFRDFDHDRENRFDTLRTIFRTERMLAQAAFEDALGLKVNCITKSGEVSRDDYTETLIELYAEIGLVGKNEAEQLIRGFEAQAAAQAPKKSSPEHGI